MSEIHHLSALETWDALHSRALGIREVTAHYLDRIDRLDAPERGGPNAFATVTGELALDRATALEAMDDRSGQIFGIPLADKDLNARRGVPTKFGSAAYADFVPAASDDVVRTLDAAGAVSLGKTTTPEFGMTGYTASALTGVTTIPGHPKFGAGGSSGGAAAAVAAGLLPFAPGSDGGGSIRIPAAACGLVGLKPTRGRIPALSCTGSLGGLSVVGGIGRTVADVALLTDALIGRVNGRVPYRETLRSPERDDGSLVAPAVRGELGDGTGRFRLAVLTGPSPWADTYDTPLSIEARAAVAAAIELAIALGHEVDEVALPAMPDYAEAFTTIWRAGAAALPLDDAALAAVTPLTRWLVEAGRAMSIRQIPAALQSFARIEHDVLHAFAPYDAVIAPTTALTPRPVDWYGDDPATDFERQCQYTPHTSFVNVTGLPALQLPVHALPDGLSMGVQLIGRPGEEATLLAIGRQFERRVPWRERIEAGWR